jgi:hypothetical protein
LLILPAPCRRESPVPVFAAVPTLIVCLVIIVILGQML